ncbi:MAG: hypothetical protein MPF33_10005 [Candidatus Aramenus sp.]|jgi:hypothetical protein|nr:hypothetical protein [Candidatus Aramenus sp.]
MEEDDKIFDFIEAEEPPRNSLMRKLDEIEFLLRTLMKEKREKEESLCEVILEKTYIVTNRRVNQNTHPNLFVMKLDSSNYLVTFKDTMDLLKLYMKMGERVEDEMPKRLRLLFTFLKNNGLVYYDAESKEYKLV